MNADALRSLTQIAGNTEVVSVFGELDEASGKIVLFDDSGNDHDRRDIGIRLSVCTPKFSPTKDGPLLVPCSWEAVTQIVHSFPDKHRYRWCPGPKLSAWLVQEIIRRSCQGDLLGEKPSREPMAHQSVGAIAIGMNGRFLLADEPGPQPVSTPVLTPSGWTELGKLTIGDYVFSVDGEPTRVEEVKFFGKRPVYRVTLNDRTSTLATEDHRWSVYGPNDRFWNTDRVRPRPPRVMSVKELLKAGLFTGATKYPGAKWFLPPQPVVSSGTASNLLPVPPYLYGALLGDGSIGTPGALSFTSGDEDILSRVWRESGKLGTSANLYYPAKGAPHLSFHRDGTLSSALKALDGFHRAEGKYVHDTYLSGDEEVRWELLRGLLDTDGHAQKGAGSSAEFVSVSPRLASDVAFLGRSLGAVVTESGAQPAGYVNLAGHRVPCKDKYRVYLRFPVESPVPFWCGRKRAVWVRQRSLIQRKVPSRSIRSIEPAGEAEVCCIRVKSGANVYLTGTALIPTHNSGKTATALQGLAELEARHRNPWPALVVCPAAVIDPWLEEAAIVYPYWNVRAYRGPNRKKLLGLSPREKLILVMSYETMRNDMGDAGVKSVLEKFKPGTIVSDECHKLCNHDTKQSVRMRRLAKKVPNFIGASGTPITKNAGNFWPILFSMFPESYPDRERYNNRYTNINPYANDGHGEIGGLNPLREPEFRDVMRGTMRRVAKSDVLKDLPPKTYQTRWTDIPPKWRKAYDEMEEDMLAHLPDAEHQTPLEAMSSLAKMTRLRQLANSACDVEVIESNEWDELAGDYKREVRVHPKEPCWKGDMLLEIMEELHQDDAGSGIQHGHRPVIAFAPYRKLVMLAGGMAERKGYKVGYIVGGMTDAQRTAVRHEFQAGKLDLIGVSTGAGGAGLTLTAADTVVFLARPWGMVEATQAEDRAHRAGQLKHVQIVDLEARNSVESRVRAALKDKMRNLSELVNDTRMVKEFLGG